MREGERQVAPTLDGIRKDHVERYRWAAGLVKGQFVLDVACGVGYGASLLADAGASVSAFDQEQEAIDFARAHYARNAVCYRRWDIDHLLRADYNSPLHGGARFGEHVDAAIAFEIIEHLEDPRSMLRDLHKITGTLLASVPNERVFPFRSLATLRGERVGSPRTVRFHHRHYTLDEFADLLAETGWTVEEWLGQVGPHDPVEPGVEGRTIVVRARRRIAGDELLPVFSRPFLAEDRAPLTDAPCVIQPAKAPLRITAIDEAPAKAPEHVVILGMGPSAEDYVSVVKKLGSRQAFADEVWGINAIGAVIQCDRVFHMDDVRIQEIRAAAAPESNIANMLAWLRSYQGTVYTSRAHPDYPCLVEFPLEYALQNGAGYPYFNGTAAYAVAYAIVLGVKRISFFGIDFTYPNQADAEKGRGCVEFWLGMAAARGIVLSISKRSSLMDMVEPADRRLYGYDTLKVAIAHDDAGKPSVSFEPRPAEDLPTADEIEDRYDHTDPRDRSTVA